MIRTRSGAVLHRVVDLEHHTGDGTVIVDVRDPMALHSPVERYSVRVTDARTQTIICTEQ